ncbi:MAG: AlpA family phage regulatory protein [Gammaproteobacteria bacterium]|nr:AlpA family phage regulatory protein [Gammaproteobacteria bacterium]
MSGPHFPIQSAVLRLVDLQEYLKLSKTAIYALAERDPSFPRRIVLGPRSVAWRRAEIDAWLANRPVAVKGACDPGRGKAVHPSAGGVAPAR